MGRKKKISIYICGMVIDTSVFEDSIIEKTINERYEKWLGKGNVRFSISRNEEEKEFTLCFNRNWEEQMNPMYPDTLFAGDWQIWFGDSYHDNRYPERKLCHWIKGKGMLFYDDIQGIKLMYIEKAKALGASRPKDIEFIENNENEFVVKIKY